MSLVSSTLVGGVLTCRVTAPGGASLTAPSCRDLVTEVRTLAADSLGVRVVVLAGDFADTASSLPSLSGRRARSDLNEAVQTTALGLQSLAQPTIAQVRGTCTGPCFILAMSCDLVLADSATTFGGVADVLAAGLSRALLTRITGSKQLVDALTTRRLVSAQSAARIGLINGCVAPGNLERRVSDWAGELVAMDAASLAERKLVLNAAAGWSSGLPLSPGPGERA